jgi:WS/DGAT/MGAT family acyltransferase
MLMYMFDLEPEPTNPIPIPEMPDFGEKPSEFSLLRRGLFDMARRPFGMVRLIPPTIYRFSNLILNKRGKDEPGMPTPFTAPRTSFNGALTPHRKIAWRQVSLDDVKKVKQAFGVTVNDVVLAVTGGALLRYLEALGETPDKSLIASVPVSVHDETKDEVGTNKVSILFTTLATDIKDPVERLRHISAAMGEAKEEHKLVGADTLQQWAKYATPNVFALAARIYSGFNLAERHPVVHNLIVSNVPGPPFPLYFAGAKLVAIYPLGPILEGAGLNVTVLSNMDQVGFGFIACRELAPQLWDLADAVPDALAELVKEADRQTARDNGPKPKKKAKKTAAAE